VIDFDDLGAEEVCEVLANARYPNRCISPDVKSVETREVDWSDEHPLNHSATAESAYRELFGAEERET